MVRRGNHSKERIHDENDSISSSVPGPVRDTVEPRRCPSLPAARLGSGLRLLLRRSLCRNGPLLCRIRLWTLRKRLVLVLWPGAGRRIDAGCCRLCTVDGTHPRRSPRARSDAHGCSPALLRSAGHDASFELSAEETVARRSGKTSSDIRAARRAPLCRRGCPTADGWGCHVVESRTTHPPHSRVDGNRWTSNAKQFRREKGDVGADHDEPERPHAEEHPDPDMDQHSAE